MTYFQKKSLTCLTIMMMLIALLTVQVFADTDNTAPNITLSKTSGSVNYNDTIVVTASDSSGINHIGYAWDSNPTTPVYSSTATIIVPSNLSTGTHYLHVYAKDNSSNYNYTGWKDYTFYVNGSSSGSSSGSSDTKEPSLSLSKTSGTVYYGDKIKITASDSSGINHIGYAWDSKPTTSVYSDTAYVEVPSSLSTGTHTLHVYAKDNSSNYNNTGWKDYTYTVKDNSSSSSDTKVPTISLSRSSGSSVDYGDAITITASDSSGINHIGYAWDSNPTTPVYSSSTTIYVPSTLSSGAHTLHVYAKDNSSNYNYTGWKDYTFYVNSSSSSNDTKVPTISLSRSSGSSVDYGDAITITASDSSGIHHIGYAWDGNSTTAVYSSSTTIYVPSTLSSGTHTLHVYAKDNSSNYNYTGWKDYTYTVNGSSNNGDITAPTISLSKTSGNVNYNDAITITASDSSGINHIGYAWDSNPTTPVYSSSTTIYVPSSLSSGAHTLRVYAKDNSSNYNYTGWKEYTFYVNGSSNNGDTTAPTISLSKTSGKVNYNDAITITASDSSGIHHIGYAWDGNPTTPVYSNSTTIYVPSTLSSGTHTLHVYAKDNSPNYNYTGWKDYTYTVNAGSNNGDTTAPTLSLSKTSGTITVNETITITASDNSGIHHIGYAWDGNSTTPVYASTATVTVPSNFAAGTHTLHVYAKDNSPNYNNTGWKYYTYTLNGSGNNNAPTITVSPNGGSIDQNEEIIITASDSDGIDYIEYAWDNNSYSRKYSSSISVYSPSSTGAHTLHVRAYDKSSSHNTSSGSYSFNVTNENDDDSCPSVTVIVSGGSIDSKDEIEISAEDPDDIDYIEYAWDNNSFTRKSDDSFEVKAPSNKGAHTLHVRAADEDGNITDTLDFEYMVEGDAPSVTVEVSGGGIGPREKIKITADDADDIDYIEYAWDNESYRKTSSDSFYVFAPSDEGEHTLRVRAKDEDGDDTGVLRFKYIVSDENDDDEDNDYNGPTVTVLPSGGSIKSKAEIDISAEDPDDVDYIEYAWDDESFKSKSTDSFEIEAPSSSGEHTLHVIAVDEDGNITELDFEYDVKGDSPTVSVEVSGGPIAPEETISISAEDSDGIDYIEYAWDNDSFTKESSDSIEITAPDDEGEHTLRVRVKDEDGDATDTLRFEYFINDEDNDGDAPSIDVNPSSGTLPPNSSVITVTAKAANKNDDIRYIYYYWDNNAVTKVNRDSVTITTPSTTGSHTLYVYADDDSDEHNKSKTKSYTYTIGTSNGGLNEEYPASNGGNGVINPAVKTLRIELRNAANRIKYQQNEDITYYIDYYNGYNTQVNNVVAYLEIPDGFTVTNYYQGIKNGNTIEWSLGNLTPMQSGRLQVQMRCTANISSGLEVLLRSYINKDGGQTQDRSVLLNYIYRAGATSYHTKYISGYTDNTFRPEKGITRAELATMFVRLFNIDTTSAATSYNRYRDVNKKHWAYTAIIACTEAGVFGGYSDGTFKPESVVTRAEFAAALVKKLNIDNPDPIWIHGTDIKNSWALNAMEQLNRLNMLLGYSDGTFRPNAKITRAEAVTLLNRFTYRGPLNTYGSTFKDVKPTHWASLQIEEAARSHNSTRTANGDEQ